MATLSGRDIATLERAVSNELAKYSQDGQGVYSKIFPIKVNSMNPQFPVFEGMQGYNPNGNMGTGGDKVQVLMPPSSYRPAAVFQQERTFQIPIAAKRAMAGIDDTNGEELVKIVTQGVLDSKEVTFDYNIHNAVASQTYTNGTNIFACGNINADTAGQGFREGINNAIKYLKDTLNGLSKSKKVIVVIPEESWYQLSASQKLANYLNGYAQIGSNISVSTLNQIFTENAGINVEFQVAGLRFLDSKFAKGRAELIWNENLSMYAFVTTDSVYAERASIKRLEGIEMLKADIVGFTTVVDFYCEYGYYIDVPEAFAKIEFTKA